MLAVMASFGFDVEKLNGPKIHSLQNVMTLECDMHDAFDRLALWFESTVGTLVKAIYALILT